MKFEDALKCMREGKKVKSKFTPILWLENGEIWYKCKQGTFNYFLTTGEVLAEDWEVVDEYPMVLLFKCCGSLFNNLL